MNLINETNFDPNEDFYQGNEINHTVKINRMNEIPFLADEIHHLRFRPRIIDDINNIYRK